MLRSTLQRMMGRGIPRGIRVVLRTFTILNYQFGHWKTAVRRESIDHDNHALPWYTYPAIEYLRQLDFHDKQVFEYGSGHSTLFWASVARQVVSIESDEDWYRRLQVKLPDNVQYLLIEDRDEYAQAIDRFPDGFDVIIVDGGPRNQCAMQAAKRLRCGGMIILDNSERDQRAAAILGQRDFIQVDMHGFGPINAHTWTTSLFLDRQFSMKSRFPHQPVPGVGSLRKS